MADEDYPQKLEELKAHADKLRKKIAYISGSKATKIIKELDKIDKNISLIYRRTTTRSFNTEEEREEMIIIPSSESPPIELSSPDQPPKKDRPPKSKDIILALLCLFLISFGCQYLKALLVTPKTRSIETNNVKVKIQYPHNIKKNKEFELIFSAYRITDKPCKTKIILDSKSEDFYADMWIYDFDLTNATQDGWKNNITYNSNDYVLQDLYHFVKTEDIEVKLLNEANQLSAETCLTFTINIILNIFIAAISCLTGIIIGLIALINTGVLKSIVNRISK